MQKFIYFLLIVLLGLPACTERPEQPSYLPQLVRIDSLLQADFLQWKNLSRGKVTADSFLIKEEFHEDSVYSGDIGIIRREGKWFIAGDVLHPLDGSFTELGIKDKTNNPAFLLKYFPPEVLATEADSMYHALLTSEAQVKEYIARKGTHYDWNKSYLTTDSLIRRATAYYDRQGDDRMKARAHFLLGFYLRMDNRAEAVRELMTASHYAEQTGDKVLLAVIYRFMGRELYYAKVYRQSDSIFHLAEDLAIEQQDTLLWMESLLHPLLPGQAFGLNVSTHQQRLRQCELGMKLAHSYGHREYEGDFVRLMAEEYLRWQYRNTGYKEKALHYAKQAYRLGNNRKVHEVLANAYVATGHLDSAAVHFDTVYGKNWRETGTGGIGTFAVYEPSNQEEVAAAEITLQKEWQQAEYEGFLTRYKHLLLGIAIGAVALIALLHLYHRRKYRRQSELLQAQQKKQQLLHGILQENLQKKDEEIARLLKERAQRHADEEAQQALTEELSAANENRRILAKETLEHSPAYNKVQLIMANFRWKEESDHRLTDADWQELADCVDTCYGQMLKRLAYQYKLTDREVSICCLLKLDIPVVHIAHLIGYTRPVVYKTERSILAKMGFPYEKGALRKLLKKY